MQGLLDDIRTYYFNFPFRVSTLWSGNTIKLAIINQYKSDDNKTAYVSSASPGHAATE